MISLLLASACFLGALLSHALGVRRGWLALHPRDAAGASLLWLAVLAAALARHSAPMPVSAALIYVCLCLVYADQVLVLADRSPSLEILRLVGTGAREATPPARLAAHFTDEAWIRQRLETLVRDGLVAREGPAYRLLPRALPLVRWTLAYRALLRRGWGAEG